MQAPSPRGGGKLGGGCTGSPKSELPDGKCCKGVAVGGVMDDSAVEWSVEKRCREPAGRLLDGLLTSDPTAFASLPGKLSGDILPTNPTSSETE